MHIPSGITVTKHNIKNSFSNGSIKNVNPILSLENNNNNNNNKNIAKSKAIKSTATQNPSVYSKTSNTMATITSVPIPQPCKLSAVSTVLQKNITQSIQKSVSQLTMATSGVQKSVTTTPTSMQQNTLTAAPVALKSNQFQQQQQLKLTAPSMLPSQLQQQQQQQYPQKATLSITHQKITTTPTLTLNQQQSMLAITQQRLQAMHTMQKPTAHTQVQQQQPRPEVQLSITPKLQTTQKMPQRLPIVQKQPLTPTLTTMTNLTQLKENQELKQAPLSALNTTTLSVRKLKHQHRQHQEETSKSPLPANYSIKYSNNPTSPPLLANQTPTTTPILSKFQTMATAGVNCDSAARTIPYKTKASTKTTIAATTIRNVQSLPSSSSIADGTIQSTPPSRLLASPPHCVAALNEPLLLNLPATTSITPQLTPTTTPPPTSASPLVTTVAGVKLQAFPAACITQVKKTLGKRVQPTTVLQKSDEEWRKHMAQQQQLQLQQRHKLKNSTNTPTILLVESPPTTPPTENVEPDNMKRKTLPTSSISSASVFLKQSTTAHDFASRAPLVGEYATLLQLCREHDRSKDMQRLIDNKLIKYYYSVHESFVRSRGFRKQLLQAMERIRSDPDMIYVHLKCVVEELKVRRKAKVQEQVPQKIDPLVSDKATVVASDAHCAVPSLSVDNPAGSDPAEGAITGNRRTEERIRKLNRTLYTITKRISALEEADVDWNDDDDSSYLQVERYKKRACQIYEKICDLTGESKSAHRQMKQPIMFKDTPYPQFNRTLSAFVNRMHEFPDYYDVLKLLEHCNKEKELGLASFEMKRIGKFKVIRF